MKINSTKVVQVDVKTLNIHVKCCDDFTARICDQEGDVIKDYEGYVPNFMPGDHFGDYIILDIDLETGKILNWKPPTSEQLERFIKEGNEQ